MPKPHSRNNSEEIPLTTTYDLPGASSDVDEMQSAQYLAGPERQYGLEPFFNFLKENPILIPVVLYGLVSAFSNAVNGFLYPSSASPDKLLEPEWWHNQSAGELTLATSSAVSAEATNAILNVFFLLSIVTSFYATKRFLTKKPGYLALAAPLEVCAIASAAAQSMISYDNFDFLSEANKNLVAVNILLTGLTFVQTALSRTFGANRSIRILASQFDDNATFQHELYEQLHHLRSLTPQKLESAFQKAVLRAVKTKYHEAITNAADNQQRFLHLNPKDDHLKTEILIELFKILSKPKNNASAEQSKLSVALSHLAVAFDHLFGVVVCAAPTFITYSEKTFSAVRKAAKLFDSEDQVLSLNDNLKRLISSPGGMGSALLYYVSGKQLRLNLINVFDHLREHRNEPAEYVKIVTCFVLAATSGLSMADVAHKIEKDLDNDIFRLPPESPLSKAYMYGQMLGAIVVNFNGLINQLVLKNPSLVIAVNEDASIAIANRKYTLKAFMRALHDPAANPLDITPDDKIELSSLSLWKKASNPEEGRPNSEPSAEASLLLKK